LGAAAFLAALLCTPLVRRWAAAARFVDQPGGRKTHPRPVPLGGGVVIFWITLLPVGAAAVLALWASRHGAPPWLPHTLSRHLPGLAARAPQTAVFLAVAAALHLLGLIDDKRSLGPAVKLIVQLALATLLATAADVRFSLFIPYPALATALSVVWIVVIINAFNFLDNMDGLAAGIALIAAAIILAPALAAGQVFVSALLTLLIGALAGFLVYNFPPASIFLGDAGSLLIGLLLVTASVRTTYYHHDLPAAPRYATLLPLLALAVPLYDFASVTLLRLLQGKSLFVGDQQHFSHRLVRRGMSTRHAVLTIYLATAATGLGAALLPHVPAPAALIIAAQTLLVILLIALLERPPAQPPAHP